MIRLIRENKHENPTRKEVDEVCRSPFTSTFFSWISSWWTFWKSNTKPNDLTAHPDIIYSRKPELFEDSKLSEVDQSASHFEGPKSSKLRLDVSHPPQPHWDDIGVSISMLSVIKEEALFLSDIDLHHIPGICKVASPIVASNPASPLLMKEKKDFKFETNVQPLWLFKWNPNDIITFSMREEEYTYHEFEALANKAFFNRYCSSEGRSSSYVEKEFWHVMTHGGKGTVEYGVNIEGSAYPCEPADRLGSSKWYLKINKRPFCAFFVAHISYNLPVENGMEITI